MWRFVVICLGVMAFAFYELSGGADYEPAPDSLQAQARLPESERLTTRPKPEEPPQEVREVTAPIDPEIDNALGAADTRAAEPAEETERVSVTLLPPRTDSIGLLEELEDSPVFGTLTDPTLLDRDDLSAVQDADSSETPPAPENATIDAAVAAALGQLIIDDSQIRLIAEPVVDIRTGPGLSFDLVTRLKRGTEVAVLEDPGFGWLNVQVVGQFQSGWVAEWLLERPQ